MADAPTEQTPGPVARPRGFGPWLLVALACALLGHAPLPGQGRPDRGRLFSLPRSQDDIFEVRRAREEIDAGNPASAIERLLALLRSGHGGAVPLGPSGERFVGLRAAVTAALRDLPEKARTIYEDAVRRDAGGAATSGLHTLDTEELERLASRFPCSTLGTNASVLLADRALEAGVGHAASVHLRTALDGLPPGSPRRSALLERMAMARTMTGAEPEASFSAKLRGIAAATREHLAPELRERRKLIGWPAYGGGGSGRAEMFPPAGQPAAEPKVQVRARAIGFDHRPLVMQPIGGLDGIYVNDGLRLHAIDPLRQSTLWVADGPLAQNPRGRIEDYLEAINRDAVLSAACSEDIVVAALQVPSAKFRTQRFRQISVISELPSRRLFAFERSTGRRLWAHWDRPDGPLARLYKTHDAAGPPLIGGDTVYVASHDPSGAIVYWLTAYDLRTGATKWRTLVCSSQGEVNMFGNSFREFAAGPLALIDGVIYGTTNLGVCFAADAGTGAMRWITAYEAIDLPETRLTDQQDRSVYFANNPPVVADGVLCTTPLDSAYVLGIDCETGRPLWRHPFRFKVRSGRRDVSCDVRWLLGAIEDSFIVAGEGVYGIAARPTATEALAATVHEIVPASALLGGEQRRYVQTLPRGALSEDHIYVPGPSGLRVFDADGRRIDLMLPGQDVGNVLLVDGLIVSLRSPELAVYYDREQLLRTAEIAYQEHRDDPATILRYASLLRISPSESRRRRAEELYRDGLRRARANGLTSDSPTLRELAGELFTLLETRAKRMASQRPKDALAILRDARQYAPDDNRWLDAQVQILQWIRTRPEEIRAELDAMATRCGGSQHSFPGLGRMPVAAYVLWRRTEVAQSPTAAIEACQELMDRFATLRIGDQTAATLARDRQGSWIQRAGPEAYAGIEARAGEALAAAGQDPDLLQGVRDRFPHSAAAQKSIDRILDLAVASGDLATATTGFAAAVRTNTAQAGAFRRMMVAATAAGNAPLAQRLATYLASNYGDAKSDYHADGGRSIRDVVAGQLEPKPAPAVLPTLPTRVTATWQHRERGESVRVCGLAQPAGFARRDDVPIYFSVGERLLAFDADRGSEAFEDTLFEVPFRYQDGEDLVVCSDTLILAEDNRLRGVDYRTGDIRWSVDAPSNRMLQALGVENGLVYLLSEFRGTSGATAGDGGRVLAVEPLQGGVMFEHLFPLQAELVHPALSDGSLWVYRPVSEEHGPHIQQLDGMTGREARKVPLEANLLRELGLSEATERSWRIFSLPRVMFARGNRLILPLESGDREPPRVAAIDIRTGKRLWVWRGSAKRILQMCAPYRDQVVVIEQGNHSRGAAGSGPLGSRLVVLDIESGREDLDRGLGSFAAPANWRNGLNDRPAPDKLLIRSRRDQAEELTCVRLDGSGRSFRYSLPGQFDRILQFPIVGSGFLALPVGARARSPARILVVDLDRRKSLIPGSPLGLAVRAPNLSLLRSGRHILYHQSNGSVTLLSNK